MFKDKYGTEWNVGDKGTGKIMIDYAYDLEIEIMSSELGDKKLYAFVRSNGSKQPHIEEIEILNHIRFTKKN
ncbi:hypothetical protein HKC13_001904 [Campylobacter coli]|uniref:hypothetical protein n=1 Tax=Campylobacter coli TaxID=195 RepID=UPI001272E439|nr:hypothetical protein [Campylobacter coli]EAJ6962791.1 hypothetical protein [Campylobacter jejuni]EAJ2046799.1 hypothetical protein [Campylobacter coli]EAK7055210.1 hypothetical protein [Campylobacter jejuni]EAL1666601.1 hypothetical protein [Campylobacter coli]